jgi:hypothetical protein
VKQLQGLQVLSVFLICVLIGLPTQTALGQNSNSGVIEGTVQDSSGSVVPGVAVDIMNVQTGTHMIKTTNADGLYTATSVPLGEYSITFSRAGFETFVHNGLVVYVGTTTVNAALQVGHTSERVTVTGEAPLLETDNSDQTTTLDTHAVESMPVVGTDWRSLDGVLPGVNAAGNQAANGQYVGFNGTQGDTVAWLFDGSPAVLAQDFAPSQLYPPADAIQEVTANTANFSAQYGDGMSVINVITKSGTNHIHGSLYEQIENNVLEARNYFDLGPVTPEKWNNFGGDIGGPILKNKLFLFVSYMENPNVYTTPTYFTFPTVAMRQGNFSDPEFPTIYNPSSLTYVNGTATRIPLPGNQVTTIDPVAAKIQAFWPLPNNLGPNGDSIYNNYYYPVKGYETNRWYEGKIDYDINQRNRLSFSEMVEPQNRPNPDPRCPLDCYSGIFKDQAGQLTYTSTISPNLVNEFRFGYAREYVREVTDSENKGYPSQIGLLNAPANIFPMISVSGVESSELDGGVTALQAPGTELISDFITLVRGKHVIKIGGEFDRYHMNLTSWGNISAGNFYFTGIATRNPADPTSTGLGYADLLFGLPQSWNVTEQTENAVHISVGGAFVQDDYKILPKVTLNLGVRWEPQGGWGVKDNDFGVFDPTLNNSATNTPGAMDFGGNNGRYTIQNAALHTFAPRVGISWNPLKHWAVRASYGIFDVFRTEEPYTDNMVGVGENAQGSLTSSDNINPVFTLGPNEGYNQGYVQGPPLPVYPTKASLTPEALNGQSVDYEARSIPTQYVQEIYLNVQREISGGILLDAGYVNTMGVHLQFERDINQVPQALLGPGNAQNSRPYPNFQSIVGSLWDGTSNYNALQLRAEKHASHGLLFTVNYAWSKTLDTGTASGSSTGIDVYQQSYDRQANYGLSELDDPYMFNGLASYALPFGYGRRYVDRHGLLDEIIGGWQAGAFFQVHGGIPFTPVMGTANLSNSLAGAWFPNRMGNGKLSHPTINKWFDTSAFQEPAPYTFGNSGRNILLGPNWRSVDANLLKTFDLNQLRAGTAFQFRVDAYDLPNHPNFGQPNANIGTAGAGIISSANTSRNFEFTGRIIF